MKKLKDLFELFYIFFKLGFVSFGGGLAILKIYEDELVKKKKYITEEELLDYYAISQTIPGIVIVNVALFVGNKRAGILGMLATMLGVIIPSIIVITLIAANYAECSKYKITECILQGISIGICTIITILTYDIGRRNIKSVLSALIAIGSFVALHFFNVPIYIVIIVVVIISLLAKDKEAKND